MTLSLYANHVVQFPGNYNLPEDLKDFNLLEPSNPDSQQYVQDKCQTDKLDKEALVDYASFAIKVTELLQQRGIDVKVLILACSCLNKDKGVDLPCDIREANSIESLVQALQKNQTWYNYGILEYFATYFGEKEGEKLVESYEGRLKHNVERRVKTQEMPKEASKLVVKLNWNNYSDQDIVNFHNMLATILKRDTHEFVLKRVGKGCVELVYIIPADLCESIRGLKTTDLEEYGVILLNIDE